jgi:heme/copper-type cytochrome/quinol oxidase subunit 2
VAAVLLFVIFQSVPWILLLTLVGCLYLVWVDVKDEPDLEFQIKIWWFLLVLLLHVLGYLIFRVWLAVRRRGRRADGQA